MVVLGRFLCECLVCLMNLLIGNIVAHYCVIPSGWPKVMNYSGVVIKTLYRASVVGRISGQEGY